MSSVGPPEGKVWIVVNGVANDDLFEVDASDADQEIAAAKQMFRRRYTSDAIMKAGHVRSKEDL